MKSETTVGMSYELLVEEGRAARLAGDGVQWKLGDLAAQVELLTSPPRDEDGRSIKGPLHRYAQDLDVNHATLRNYRSTARAWPPSRRREGASFETHFSLAAQSDRFDLIHDGMKLAEARKIVTARMRGASGKPNWYELLGIVGDELTKASKDLAKAEAEIGEPRTPTGAAKLIEKAGVYAERAEDIASRLRAIADRLAVS